MELFSEAGKRTNIERTGCYHVQDVERITIKFLQDTLDRVAMLAKRLQLHVDRCLNLREIPWEASFVCSDWLLVADGGYS